ncbi:hypothetical protein VIGAN_05276900 [Vigna angularis var. angularis]|uniref:Uncharacterized protein n=1 Tax=Vigna angularis var. angularis TaxID=157739 RepID=A0A0S3S8B9_PHAAN|nr:hypothetical protein VIGAN_05276900 [Vigna angularis var. angularis]
MKEPMRVDEEDVEQMILHFEETSKNSWASIIHIISNHRERRAATLERQAFQQTSQDQTRRKGREAAAHEELTALDQKRGEEHTDRILWRFTSRTSILHELYIVQKQSYMEYVMTKFQSSFGSEVVEPEGRDLTFCFGPSQAHRYGSYHNKRRALDRRKGVGSRSRSRVEAF